MEEDKYYLTKDRARELEEELKELKEKRRPEVAERLKRAKEYGDLSENSEYSEAREEQELVERRIFELEELLRNAIIIKKTKGDTVEVGSTVTVEKDKQILRYTIVGSYDVNPEEGKISDESPLGRAFLHHKIGDAVIVTTPAGQIVYKIIKIE